MGLASRFSNRPPVLRFLKYARASWQRLGHLKMLCSVASPANSYNLEGITSRFQTSICKLIPVPPESHQQVSDYVRNNRNREYPDGLPDVIELQDYFLADPELPSHVGALTGRRRPVDYLHMEYVEIPAWATRLKLLREGNYTLTDRGKILGILPKPVNKLVGNKVSFKENPFHISDGEKYLFLYWLLEADGDILKRVYKETKAKINEMSLALVGETMLKVLRDLNTTAKLPSNELGSLNNMIKSLENNSNQVIIPRVEPLVDCQAITRTHLKNYTYSLSKNADLFWDYVNGFSTLDDLFEYGLAEACISLFGTNSTKSQKNIWHYIADSYLRMRSGLGYCSILELSMLSVASAINNHHEYFEIHDVEQSMISLSKEYGTKVRFTKNRQGNIALVRIDRQLAESLNAVV